MVWVQGEEIVHHEEPVLADRLVIKTDLTTAKIWALNADQVPVDLTAVAVVCFLVGLPRREVEAASDLFIKKDVFHRLQNVWIETDGKLTDESCPLISVKHFVQSVTANGGGRLRNAALSEGQPHVLKRHAAIERGCIEGDDALDGVALRSSEDFTVGDVPVTGARHRGNVFDRETEVGLAWSDDVNTVGAIHPLSKFGCRRSHASVVETANPEVEVFKLVGPHAR